MKPISNRHLKSVIYIFLAIFICACTKSPSDQYSKIAIENKFNNLIKVVSFSKLNAKQKEFGGKKMYEIKYSAVVEYVDNVLLGGIVNYQIMNIKKGK